MPDIHLRADYGHYVCAEGGGVVRFANRPGSGPWERCGVEYAKSYSDASSGEPRAEVAIHDMLDEEEA